MMPGLFRLAISEIASYDIFLNAIDLRLKNSRKIRFAVGVHKLKVELFLQQQGVLCEEKG